MNKITERIKLIRAMDEVVHCINDEDILLQWLAYGVADGDIDDYTTDEELYYYLDDDIFKDLMKLFLIVMSRAKKLGGLYCDGVCSDD